MKKLLLPKSYYLEFAAATLLYIVNVLLTLFFPYFTAHKAYYDSTAYITVLTTAYLIYVIRIHLTAKKAHRILPLYYLLFLSFGSFPINWDSYTMIC